MFVDSFDFLEVFFLNVENIVFWIDLICGIGWGKFKRKNSLNKKVIENDHQPCQPGNECIGQMV